MQLAKPATHVYWQLPSAQPVLCMLAGAASSQSFPQAPQSVAVVLRLVSQPLPPPPSQSPKPGSQVWSQAPATQTGVALFQSSGQLVKQSPQRVTSVSVLV